MFALHEATQRRVCRILFVALCVLPTLGTIGGVGYYYRPWRLADWQETLSHQFHLQTTVAGVSQPLPDRRVFEKLSLADLHSSAPLCQFGRIEQRWNNSKLQLHADNLEIELKHLPKLAQSLTTWLAAEDYSPFQLTVDKIKFTGSDNRHATWEQLILRGGVRGDSIKTVQVLLAKENETTPVKMLVEYLTSETGPTLECRIETQENTVTTLLLEHLVPGGWHRSPEARFSGSMLLSWHEQQLTGMLKGSFTEVDLSAWLGAANPDLIKASSQLQFDQIVWQGERIQIAEGQLTAHDGTVSGSLLKSAKALLECGEGNAYPKALAAIPVEEIPFDQLAMRFRIDETGLLIMGQSASSPLLTHQGEPVVYQPAQKLPVTRLVRLFHLHVAGWLPDTLEAHEMANRLPLPSSAK